MIELYNLKDDPAESMDVAASHPGVLRRLEHVMRQQHTKSELFPLPGLDQR